jgi:hypothetical protein
MESKATGIEVRHGVAGNVRHAVRPLTMAAVVLYGLLIAFNVALHAWKANADMWVRLASGRLVVDNHIIPRHDPFTFTVRGHAWIDHEWLLGAAMYATNRVSFELLVVIAAIAAILPFWMMHRLVTKDCDDDWLLLALSGFAVLVSWRAYAIRPQLVNPILFVALVWLIDDRRRTGSRRIWWAVPLTLVWANLQAGFLVSIAVLAAWSAICFVERRDRRLSLAVLAAASVVPLLNAYGYELYRYSVLASLSNNTDRARVAEWRSPDFHDYLNLLLLAGIAIFAYFGTRSADLFRSWLGLCTLAASLISARFEPFFALAMLYTVGPQLPHVAMPRMLGRALILATPSIALLAGWSVVGTATNDPPTLKVPVEGVAYLRAHAPGARVYADQSFGSYMTWEGWPTFFDTRTTQVFPESLISDYHKVELTQGDWLAILVAWRIDYVMVAPESDLAEALDGAHWPRVFEGPTEVIWRRPARFEE